MKAVLMKAVGGVENFYIGEAPKPCLTLPTSVLVKVHAAGVNRDDIGQREGKYGYRTIEILGVEIAGEIVEVGASVAEWNVGDRVMGVVEGGGYAQFAIAMEKDLMKIPPDMDMVTAAGVPAAFRIAWEIVSNEISFSKDDYVALLIHAGASCVGAAAIQLAKLIEIQPILAAAGSDEELQLCETLGAETLINYSSGPFSEKVKEGSVNGANFVLDLVGASHWNESLKSLKSDGVMFIHGGVGGMQMENADIMPIYDNHLRIVGAPKTQDLAFFEKESFNSVVRPKIEDGSLKPIAAPVFDWNDVGKAHEFVAVDEKIGKAVLQIEQ